MKSLLNQRCIVLILIVVTLLTRSSQQQQSTCKVSPFPETATNKFNDLITKISEYFEKNDLQDGHEKMRRVLNQLGTTVFVDDNMPLLAYVVKHRQFLQENEDAALTALENKHSKNLEDLKVSLENSESRMRDRLNQTMEDFKLFIKEKMLSISRPFDCLNLLEEGQTNDGVYTIYPQGRKFNVYCDMTTDGGGWTVFLNRQKQEPQLDFSKTNLAYKNGFGSPSGELWLGNEALHLMTAMKQYSLRFDAVGNGISTDTWVEYSSFKVASKHQRYQLTLKGQNNKSTATLIFCGSMLIVSLPSRTMVEDHGSGPNNGQNCTTITGNTVMKSQNCAAGGGFGGGVGGGFWYSYCSIKLGKLPDDTVWVLWSKTDPLLRYTSSLQMKIRPVK